MNTPEKERPQIFRLFGYAGTGKTMIAKHLAANIKGHVCYMAFTGKAALMMRGNGCMGAATIHSTIYKVNQKSDGSVTFDLDPDSDAATASLIVIDECSMVGEELAKDVLSFGVPVLVLGDPAQLPPVKSAGYFTDAAPDCMLTEIHRQAADNPIIALATKVRKGEKLEYGTYGETRIVPRGTLTIDEIAKADQIIVSKNVTRHSYNRQLRRFFGRDSAAPEVGDRLVCLRNDKPSGIFNGGIFEVSEVLHRKRAKDFYRIKVSSEDFPKRGAIVVRARREFFTGGVEDPDWRDLKHNRSITATP